MLRIAEQPTLIRQRWLSSRGATAPPLVEVAVEAVVEVVVMNQRSLPWQYAHAFFLCSSAELCEVNFRWPAYMQQLCHRSQIEYALRMGTLVVLDRRRTL